MKSSPLNLGPVYLRTSQPQPRSGALLWHPWGTAATIQHHRAPNHELQLG